MWVAYLGLENSYAEEPADAASALLQRALQHTDAKAMYLAAIDLFERTSADSGGSNRSELIDTCARGMRRKFGGSCKVWLRLAQLDISAGKDPSATLDRATQALPKRKHIKLLSRAALAEFKSGSRERGRAVFEGLLQTHPKRTDLWGVYIDQEIKGGDTQPIRNLFERTIHLNLAPKKMRYFFKRYLEWESALGEQGRTEYVKTRAVEFMSAQAAQE